MKNFIPAMVLSGLLLTPCYASEKDKPKVVTEDSVSNNQMVKEESKSERLLKTERLLQTRPKYRMDKIPDKKGVILAEKTYFGQVTRQSSYQPTKKVSGWGGEGIVPAGPLLIYNNVQRFPIYAAKVREETGDTIFTESYNSAQYSIHTCRYYDIVAEYDPKYNPGDTVFLSSDRYGNFILDEAWLKYGVSRNRDATFIRTDKSGQELLFFPDW